MSRKTDNKAVLEAALQLPRQLRALLAEKLLLSLDYDDPLEVGPEWMAEIHKRCQEIDTGQVDLVPAEDVFDKIDNELG
ncbi:MAG: addiction module protein [Myxococcota bacterium]|nr:addiction module protein [Myxococcota bacterium]